MNNDNLYEEIINRSNIDVILAHYNLQPDKNGKIKCPFHNDTKPSMNIKKDKTVVKCFACGTGANAISFIEKYERIGTREAMKRAIEIQKLDIVMSNKVQEKLTPEQEKKQVLTKTLNNAIKYTKQSIISESEGSKRAMEYLKSRGISEKTIKDFHIRICPEVQRFDNRSTKKLFTYAKPSRCRS